MSAPQSVTPTARDRTGPVLRLPTQAEQRTARIMGAWFLGTFVFSIPAYFFYDPLLNHADYVVGGDHDTRIAVGALLALTALTIWAYASLHRLASNPNPEPRTPNSEPNVNTN